MDISKVQDDEVGDGTTSVVVLCGELLREAERLTDQKIHPMTIVAGFREASLSAMYIIIYTYIYNVYIHHIHHIYITSQRHIYVSLSEKGLLIVFQNRSRGLFFPLPMNFMACPPVDHPFSFSIIRDTIANCFFSFLVL